jgi:NAD(P)-dependent dehydrogenase (short-subunit alcohol dehydrogenase family)
MKEESSMDDIHGKVALVSGASRGIGRAVAATLARVGADVAIIYFSREKEALETLALVRETGQQGVLVQADVSKSSETAKIIHSVERELGQVQVLVNNAGIVIKKTSTKSRNRTGTGACGKP